MLTTSAPGCQTDTPMGRLAAHLPSASEGIAACAVELEMSSKCDGGGFFTLLLTFLTRGCVCVFTGTHVESATVCGRSSSCTPSARAAQRDQTLLLMHVHEPPLEVTPTPTPLTPTSVGGFHRSKSGAPPSTLG